MKENIVADLKEDGFCTVGFSNKEKMNLVWDEVLTLKPSDDFQAEQETGIPPQSYHCTFFDKNAGYRQKTFEILSDFFAPFISEFMPGYKMIQGNIFLKPPGSGYVYPHQNLTVVNEEIHSSYSLWCPMQDTDEMNGGMQVLPGSHGRFEKFRNTDIYWPLLPLIQGEGSDLMERLSIKAGEVLILDDSIIHGTPINESAKDRIAFHAMIIPEEASPIFCDLDHEDQEIKVYEVEDDFWQFYLPGTKPQFDQEPILEEKYSPGNYVLQDLKL